MENYRLLAGTHSDASGVSYSDNAIVSSESELEELHPGKFLKLKGSNVPELTLLKGEKPSTSKPYDITYKFTRALSAGVVVTKKGKQYLLSLLSDAECDLISNGSFDTPQAVNEFLLNYNK